MAQPTGRATTSPRRSPRRATSFQCFLLRIMTDVSQPVVSRHPLCRSLFSRIPSLPRNSPSVSQLFHLRPLVGHAKVRGLVWVRKNERQRKECSVHFGVECKNGEGMPPPPLFFSFSLILTLTSLKAALWLRHSSSRFSDVLESKSLSVDITIFPSPRCYPHRNLPRFSQIQRRFRLEWPNLSQNWLSHCGTNWKSHFRPRINSLSRIEI